MSLPSANVVRLHAADNVVVARESILPGTPINHENCVAATEIPAGHKIATAAIAVDEPARKYNQIVGIATSSIKPGQHVHTHNLGMIESAREYSIGTNVSQTEYIPETEQRSFQGIVRDDGRAGTRNYLAVITSVNCAATVARCIAETFRRPGILDAYPNVDGVVALTHGTGCGLVDGGEGHGQLQRVIAGYARHPNVAGVLFLGLGCEVNQIDALCDSAGLKEGPQFATLTIQDAGGTRQSVERGVATVREMLPIANEARRTACALEHLTLALQCGGSDGYSGVGANPALGAAADLLIRHGGTAVLSETPEIYGAEHLLLGRALSQAVGEKLIERIRWWETYTRSNNAAMNNNPAPGNIAGGLTTILEKALGSAAKAGTTNLVDVYRYAEPINSRGFVFMDSPGYDPASVTGQVASGANVICFTTGRGSVFGFKPVPSIKIATNTKMFEHMREDMDINAGEIIDGKKSIEELGEHIFDTILRVASGESTRSETLGFGDNEFVPWQIGAVL